MSQINSLLVFEVKVEVVPVGALAAAVSIRFFPSIGGEPACSGDHRDMSMIDK